MYKKTKNRFSEITSIYRSHKKAILLISLLLLLIGTIRIAKAGTNFYQQLEKLNDVIKIVMSQYVEKKDSNDIIESAINGICRSLDPHSIYLPPEENEEFQESITDEFYGIGTTIGIRDDVLTIIAPLEGTPASRLGLQAGDMIIKVNGESTAGITIEEAVKKIRGPKGTEVKLTIKREGVAEPLEFTIVRDKIELESVPYTFMADDKTGYIRIIKFAKDTNIELDKSIKKLEDKGMKRLILDLRYNPGGLLSQAVQIVSRFIDKGKLVVYTRGRLPQYSSDYYSQPAHEIKYPMIVLINQGSASAAEIVTGALQDYDRAIIIGQTSYGKGSVQQIFPLNNAQDGSAIKLTIAKYYTPSGRCIHKAPKNSSLTNSVSTNSYKTISGRIVKGGGGIKPDIEVEQAKYNKFEISIESSGAFFKYAVHYKATHNAINKDLIINDEMLKEFKEVLKEKKVEFKDEDFNKNIDFIKEGIKREIFYAVLGKIEGYKVQLKEDIQYKKALAIMENPEQLDKELRDILLKD